MRSIDPRARYVKVHDAGLLLVQLRNIGSRIGEERRWNVLSQRGNSQVQTILKPTIEADFAIDFQKQVHQTVTAKPDRSRLAIALIALPTKGGCGIREKVEW